MKTNNINCKTIRDIIHYIEEQTKPENRGCFNCRNYNEGVIFGEVYNGCKIVEDKSPFWLDEEGKDFPHYPACPYWELRLDEGFFEHVHEIIFADEAGPRDETVKKI